MAENGTAHWWRGSLQGLFCGLLLTVPFLFPARAPAKDTETAALTIGLAAVFLDEPRALMQEWADYLSRRLRRPVTFVQRRTYQELTEGLTEGGIDAGWVCTYPYLLHRRNLRLLAVPVFRGRPAYRSYLIVPAEDTVTHDILDLEGRAFAYTEPQSFSGYILPREWLKQAGRDPEHFFRTTFFTWSHRASVRAVAEGLADGAAVDGYIWESMHASLPGVTARTRVVRRSREFGFPPLVAGAGMGEQEAASLQRALLGMDGSEAGRRILAQLYLDRFEPPQPGIYAGALEILRRDAR